MPRLAFPICLATSCLAICLLPVATTLAQTERRTSPFPSERPADAAQPAVERGTADRAPGDKLPLTGRAVTFEIVIAEFVKGGKSPAAVELETPDKVLPKLKELEASGDIGALTRFHLSGIELSPARIQIGERRPVVTSRAGFAGRAPGVVEGPVSYSMENVGTIVSALSRVTEEGAVLVEIVVERTRPSLTLAKGGEPDIGRSRATTTHTQATVLIPPGKWVVLGGAQGSSEDESTQTIVLVSAKAAEPATRGVQLKIFELAHAKAPELAKVLSSVVTEKTVRITLDERTNSLIVTGTTSDLLVLEALVQKLDSAK